MGHESIKIFASLIDVNKIHLKSECSQIDLRVIYVNDEIYSEDTGELFPLEKPNRFYDKFWSDKFFILSYPSRDYGHLRLSMKKLKEVMESGECLYLKPTNFGMIQTFDDLHKKQIVPFNPIWNVEEYEKDEKTKELK